MTPSNRGRAQRAVEAIDATIRILQRITETDADDAEPMEWADRMVSDCLDLQDRIRKEMG